MRKDDQPSAQGSSACTRGGVAATCYPKDRHFRC